MTMFFEFKEYIKTHSAQLVIFGITTAILAGIAVMATGDIGQIFAGRHKH